jgi:hypothetical protein
MVLLEDRKSGYTEPVLGQAPRSPASFYLQKAIHEGSNHQKSLVSFLELRLYSSVQVLPLPCPPISCNLVVGGPAVHPGMNHDPTGY